MTELERTTGEELKLALYSGDPYHVASVLSLPPLKTRSQSTKLKADDDRKSPNRSRNNNPVSLQDGSGAEWGGVLAALVDAKEASEMGDVVRCYDAQSNLHSALNGIFGTSAGNWLVPALHTVCRNTHNTAVVADLSNIGRGERNDHSKLQNAVTLLQESFSKTLNDRTEFRPDAPLGDEGSKKAGVLYIVNHLFSMYFRLNTLRLCKNLLRPIESRKLHQQGKKGEMVTYRYYAGRLAMFEDQYQAAEQHLDYALCHCHKKAIANKKRILNYLLPVKLYRGRLPTRRLLEKYSLNEFVGLVDGLRKGDLRSFNHALQKYQDLFIRRGTYLLMEKCKTVCYRNLFKRVYLISDKHQIPLEDVAKSFKWLGMPIDLDEVECILANLIFRGFVRGYISHAKRVLVLSKRDPFPVSAVIAK